MGLSAGVIPRVLEEKRVSGTGGLRSTMSWRERICWASLCNKMKMLERWVGMCKQLKGRWNLKWEDEFYSVEVTVGSSVLKGAVSGDRISDG